MPITPTHINYYHVCHRKLWLFSQGIQMEHTSGVVEEANLIHRDSYPQRAAQFTELDLAEIFKPLLVDRTLFSVLNRQQLTAQDFHESTGRITLKEAGKKKFLRAWEERLGQTIKHRSLGRHVSYKHLVKLECYKVCNHLIGTQEYQPFKAWW